MSRKMEHATKIYMEGIKDGHYEEAINKYSGDHYTQHSTGVRDGKEGFIEFFSDFVLRNPKRDIQIIRKFEDGNYVFIQAYQNINDGQYQWITTDFFDTDQNDKLIEHWDVISEYREFPLLGRTAIDGPVQIKDLDQTNTNKQLVEGLIRNTLMSGGTSKSLDHYISKNSFIQHNDLLTDGIDAFKQWLDLSNRPICYNDIILIVGQGNFVATLCNVTATPDEILQDYAQVDIFRIEDHLIVEHWDNREPVPDVNVNSGKF